MTTTTTNGNVTRTDVADLVDDHPAEAAPVASVTVPETAPNEASAGGSASPDFAVSPSSEVSDLGLSGRARIRLLTEDTAARSVAAVMAAQWRYIPDTATWYRRDRHMWRKDTSGQHVEAVRQALRDMSAHPATEDAPWLKFRASILSGKGISSIVRLVRTDRALIASVDQLDSDPYLLCCPSGLIDLRTGAWVDGDDSVMHTRSTSCDPDWSMDTPMLRKFFAVSFANLSPEQRAEQVTWLQRAGGHSLSGDTSLHIAHYLYGAKGRGGKSQWCEIGQRIAGDYGIEVNGGLLAKKANRGHPTELMDLLGARWVTHAEMDENDKLDDALLKRLTGEPRIRARAMRSDFVSFPRTHTFWIMANQPPETQGGNSVWERLALDEWSRRVPKEERIPDVGRKIVESEGPGVLAWLINGARQVFQLGTLPETERIQRAREVYSKLADHFTRWIHERCTIQPDNARMRIPMSTLRADYERWCHSEDESPVSGKRFGQRVRGEGVSDTKSNGVKFYVGISLLTDQP